MRNTEIFSSYEYKTTPYGSISIHGSKDTARIILKDHNRNEKEVTLTVYQLKDLKKLRLFQEALEVSVEALVNTWTIKKTQNHLIKYATENELALVFSSDSDVEQDFLKLFATSFFDVEYFNEREFVNFMKNNGFSIEQLRKAEGMENEKINFLMLQTTGLRQLLQAGVHLSQVFAMDSERVKLLTNKVDGLKKLLQHGVTVNQINLIELDVLKGVLNSSNQLDDALLFVTVRQILGLDHIPSVITNIIMPKEEPGTYISLGGGGSHGAFSYKTFNNEITLTHTNTTTNVKSTLKVELRSLKDGHTPPLEKITATLSPEILIHNWFLIAKEPNTSNDVVTSIYCPELKCLMNETCSALFPEKELKDNGYRYLLIGPYYREKSFADFLIGQGSSLEELRSLQGMTQTKIKVLCKEKNTLSNLLEQGMQFTDFAKIDEDRLVHVLSHFNKAKSALKFVDVFELFGLHTSSNYSPRMFRAKGSSPTNTTQPHEEGFSCAIF